MKTTEVYTKALSIIAHFPHTNTGKPYLTMQNGARIFFDVFIDKYGIDGKATTYSRNDVVRRIRLVEFFEYIIHNYSLLIQQSTGRYCIETNFYKMVIAKKYDSQNRRRYIVISFYQK